MNDERDLERRLDLFRSRSQARGTAATSFEEAARSFADELYAEFGDVVVLARVFAVLPFGALPAADRDYVRGSFGEDATALLDDRTPVLTLFGTRGIEPDWNDRTRSRDHRAIALVSDAFVEDAPMIAKLFAEIDDSPHRQAGGDWQFVKKGADGDGLFFVGDARSSTDVRGRRVIPSEEFVVRYGVRTVFGFGKRAPDDDMLVVAIVFCRLTLMRWVAQRFARTIDILCTSPHASVARGTLFSGQSEAETA